jgi:preprotein translocase subunit SecG
MILVGLFASSIFSKVSAVSAYPGVMSQGIGAFMSVFYVAFALLYFLPSLYLYQFSTYAKKAILFTNSNDITLSLGKLKSFFKFIGIMIIVIMSLYLLIIIGVFVMMGTYSAFRQ